MSWYQLQDASQVYSPALIFYKDRIRQNLNHALRIAGGPARLRPHVKTHKTREIVRMQLEAGIDKHKCATLAEAEMLAGCGVRDILVAYNLVGPNCGRMAQLASAYPETGFCVLADQLEPAQCLSDALARVGSTVQVLLDMDVGQHRTGIAPGADAALLYEQLSRLPGLRPGGLHVYDGHNHQESYQERETAVAALLKPILLFRESLLARGLPVPRLVLGGTPTFPVYARLDLPGMECAPGTCFVHDHGYGSKFADLAGFVPAAALLTRVVSRPTATRLTLDLGTKALASDPPAGKRCLLLNVPDYQPVLQNEEHFVIESPAAGQFKPGDEVYAIPTHICPTCALHRQVYVAEEGRITERWDIAARDRVLTI